MLILSIKENKRCSKLMLILTKLSTCAIIIKTGAKSVHICTEYKFRRASYYEKDDKNVNN